LRMGECSTGSHKPGNQVRLLNPQLLLIKWWNRYTREVESLVPSGLGVRLSP
jgi:hypothetical protein